MVAVAADDQAAHLAWLRARPEIDWHRVGLIAHGDGTVPAARVAASRAPRPAFVILLSPSSARGLDDLVRRQVAQLPAERRDAMAKKLPARRMTGPPRPRHYSSIELALGHGPD